MTTSYTTGNDSDFTISVTVPFMILDEAEARKFLAGYNNADSSRELTLIARALGGTSKKVWLTPDLVQWAIDNSPYWKDKDKQ